MFSIRNVYEAEHMCGRRYAVRPDGQLGTCGWYPNIDTLAWTVQYVTADSALQALTRAAIARKKDP